MTLNCSRAGSSISETSYFVHVSVFKQAAQVSLCSSAAYRRARGNPARWGFGPDVLCHVRTSESDTTVDGREPIVSSVFSLFIPRVAPRIPTTSTVSPRSKTLADKSLLSGLMMAHRRVCKLYFYSFPSPSPTGRRRRIKEEETQHARCVPVRRE
jgi:hypothetical protein